MPNSTTSISSPMTSPAMIAARYASSASTSGAVASAARAGAVSAGASPKAASTVEGKDDAADSVEVSETAFWLGEIRKLPPVRQDLIDRVRREIERGEYDSAEKMSAALDEMIADQLER